MISENVKNFKICRLDLNNLNVGPSNIPFEYPNIFDSTFQEKKFISNRQRGDVVLETSLSLKESTKLLKVSLTLTSRCPLILRNNNLLLWITSNYLLLNNSLNWTASLSSSATVTPNAYWYCATA